MYKQYSDIFVFGKALDQKTKFNSIQIFHNKKLFVYTTIFLD